MRLAEYLGIDHETATTARKAMAQAELENSVWAWAHCTGETERIVRCRNAGVSFEDMAAAIIKSFR